MLFLDAAMGWPILGFFLRCIACFVCPILFFLFTVTAAFWWSSKKDPQIVDAIEGTTFKKVRDWTGIDIKLFKQHLRQLAYSARDGYQLENAVEETVGQIVEQPIFEQVTQGVHVDTRQIARDVKHFVQSHASDAERFIDQSEKEFKKGIETSMDHIHKYYLINSAVICGCFMAGVFVGATLGFMQAVWLALLGIGVAVIFGGSPWAKQIWFTFLGYDPEEAKREDLEFTRARASSRERIQRGYGY